MYTDPNLNQKQDVYYPNLNHKQDVYDPKLNHKQAMSRNIHT